VTEMANFECLAVYRNINWINYVPLPLYHVITAHAYSITGWAFKATFANVINHRWQSATADESRAQKKKKWSKNAKNVVFSNRKRYAKILSLSDVQV